MGRDSKIEWTRHSFNPWTGCRKQSPACAHCYAESWAKRAGRDFAARIRTSLANWNEPLRWNRAAANAGGIEPVFCASLGDVFEEHPAILPAWRSDLWALIRSTPSLMWLLLTKRPENIAAMFPAGAAAPRNVMFGITAENQEWFLRRWHYLRQVKAAGYRTFVSCEPLLGPVSLDLADAPDWVIAGGESGGKARPTHPGWVRDLRDQCSAAGVPFMHKQWGEWAPVDQWSAGRKVEVAIMPDGSHVPPDVVPQDVGGQRMRRVGKARAGRTLDGREHLASPFATASAR